MEPRDKCNCSDCTSGEVATLSPILLIYAPKPYNKPLICHITLNVCEACSKTLIVEDVISEEGWQRLCAGFYKDGKRLPERSRTQLAFERIDNRNKAFAHLAAVDPKKVLDV